MFVVYSQLPVHFCCAKQYCCYSKSVNPIIDSDSSTKSDQKGYTEKDSFILWKFFESCPFEHNSWRG